MGEKFSIRLGPGRPQRLESMTNRSSTLVEGDEHPLCKLLSP